MKIRRDAPSLVNAQNRHELTSLCPSNIPGFCPKTRNAQCWRWCRSYENKLYNAKFHNKYYIKKKVTTKRVSFAYFHFFVMNFLPKILERAEFKHLKDTPVAKFLLDPEIPYIYKVNFQKFHTFMSSHNTGTNIMHRWMRDFHKRCVYHHFLKEEKDKTRVNKRISRLKNKEQVDIYLTLLTAYLKKPQKWDWDNERMWQQASTYPPYKNVEPLIDDPDLYKEYKKVFPKEYCNSIERIGKRMLEADYSTIKNVCYTSDEEEEEEWIKEANKQVEESTFYSECQDEINKGYYKQAK